MKKLILILAAFLLTGHLCLAKSTKNELSSIKISFDRKHRVDAVPLFRTSQTPFRKYKRPIPSREGLDEMNVSASGQPSEDEIQWIRNRVSSHFNIVFVDLRKEKHAYLNGEPILWRGISLKNMLSAIPKSDLLKISDRGGSEYLVKPQRANSEEEITKKYGIRLVNFPTKHAKEPPSKVVDEFIVFADHIDPNTWVHFHCREGYSRTTMFFCMFDMLHNADKVSLDDIILRQRLIGGANMKEKSALNEQYQFLKRFYIFAKMRKNGYTSSWSNFLQSANKEISHV